MVPGFLNLPSMFFIRLDRVRSSSILFIFNTRVAAGTFPASSSASSKLVRYLMLRTSA